MKLVRQVDQELNKEEKKAIESSSLTLKKTVKEKKKKQVTDVSLDPED